ncbi:tRNA wybutosine-synthesizing protein 2 homolog isoform X3 [Melanerpes formicivorus]|uniref:tRNA wybutosine-synthesizing protein 2 homolog isoform X3 n=1 Tax=Melanerpes formicivorus TaxID=211600 RepID=UPI00358E0D02
MCPSPFPLWPRSHSLPSASGSIWKGSSCWIGATGYRRCRGDTWPCLYWRRSSPSCGCPRRYPVTWSRSRRVHRQTPAQKLREELQQLLGESWSEELERDVPHAWQRHGDLVLLSEDSFRAAQWENMGPVLWETVASALGAQRLARQGRVLPDGMRSPSVTLLLGQDGWVEHVDNGIRYTFDVTKCMFSAGNIREKLRVASLPCSGEVLVDLYAGIGYFTLPFLVHAEAAFAHACEWNGHAVEALRRNLALNGVQDRCHVHHGDSRQVSTATQPQTPCPHIASPSPSLSFQLELQDVADRVNLGLIPSSEEGWPVACRVLKKSTGGVLHIHHNVESLPVPAQSQTPVLQAEQASPEAANCDGEAQDPKEDREKETLGARIRPEWQTWAEATAARIQELLVELHGQLWCTSILHIEPVKSYAPHVHHLVLDLECRPMLST